MKVFENFEAVKFREENLIFITDNGFLYYIYNPKFNRWTKHDNAGNDRITVCNYDEVSKEELCEAMGGMFPQKETDFMRLCYPAQLWIVDMLDLLQEDFQTYMADRTIANIVHKFLLESNICYRSYLEIRKIFDTAKARNQDNSAVVIQLKELIYRILGRDIFKKEIGIVDGHDSSSYFWIMPVRVIDFSNTRKIGNVVEMRSSEISIEEDDVDVYLTPFLFKYFDKDLEANKNRIDNRWIDDDGQEQMSMLVEFERYLEYNFYTMEAISDMLGEIRDTVEALAGGRSNEFVEELRKCKSAASDELIIDFYNRFIYRMEYMMRVGKEKGYDLISFMGP